MVILNKKMSKINVFFSIDTYILQLPIIMELNVLDIHKTIPDNKKTSNFSWRTPAKLLNHTVAAVECILKSYTNHHKAKNAWTRSSPSISGTTWNAAFVSNNVWPSHLRISDPNQFSRVPQPSNYNTEYFNEGVKLRLYLSMSGQPGQVVPSPLPSEVFSPIWFLFSSSSTPCGQQCSFATLPQRWALWACRVEPSNHGILAGSLFFGGSQEQMTSTI